MEMLFEVLSEFSHLNFDIFCVGVSSHNFSIARGLVILTYSDPNPNPNPNTLTRDMQCK